MSFIDDLVGTAAAADRDGEFFVGPSDRGVAVLTEATIFKGKKDPRTYKLLFRIKESKTGANPAGTDRVVLKKLTKGTWDKTYARSQLAKMFEFKKDDNEAYRKAVETIFRIDAEGLTDETKPNPAVGLEFNFSVGPSETNDGETQYHPVFSPVKYASPEEQKAAIAENRKVMGL